MTLNERTAVAHALIDTALTLAKQPAFAISSFGKDSLVLLHLLSQHGVTNVLHLEDYDEVVDRPFIQHVTGLYGLKVYPISRGRVLFMVVGDTPIFTAMTFLSDRHLAVFPTTMIPYSGTGSYVCVDGELNAMRGTALEVQFDLLFSGIKHMDLTGKGCLSFMNLLSDESVVKRLEDSFAPTAYRESAPGLMSCDPMLYWSDAEVWEYIEQYGLIWSAAVYRDDHTKQPTKRQWCFRCHDPREPNIVACPRIGKNILNFAAQTQEQDLQIQKLGRLGLLNAQEVKELTHAE